MVEESTSSVDDVLHDFAPRDIKSFRCVSEGTSVEQQRAIVSAKTRAVSRVGIGKGNPVLVSMERSRSSSGAQMALSHHHDEAVVRTVVAAFLPRPVQRRLDEMSCRFAAGAVNVVIHEEVAHVEGIGRSCSFVPIPLRKT